VVIQTDVVRGKRNIKEITVAKKNGSMKKDAETKKTISVHPRLARAILSLKKLDPTEIDRMRGLAADAAAAGSASTGCWISDSGGEQHCINLPPDVCTRQGGISVPTRCPNN
jgi:hypothetical protein